MNTFKHLTIELMYCLTAESFAAKNLRDSCMIFLNPVVSMISNRDGSATFVDLSLWVKTNECLKKKVHVK